MRDLRGVVVAAADRTQAIVARERSGGEEAAELMSGSLLPLLMRE